MSILKETTNFFKLYRYICGKSEVPDVFHFWSAAGLISATVEDHVWFQKFKHEKLYPNLYILLVGLSGLGKGVAIGHIARLSDTVDMNKYRGKVTAAHLTDYLGKASVDEFGTRTISHPKMWLIMDELQNDVGGDVRLVRELVYMMTELYTASNYVLNTGTRTHGQVNIENPVVNWLAGTTEDDLREILDARLMRSGFVARTCFVFGEYDFNNRQPQIRYPYDYDDVFNALAARLYQLRQVQGPFMITDPAEMEIDKWYVMRPNPDEELLYSSWKRHHDLLLKFAMVLSLADESELVLTKKHIERAQAMVNRIYKFSNKLIAVSSETHETKLSNAVLKYLRKNRWAAHVDISKHFRSCYGATAQRFRAAISDLVANGLIVAGNTPTDRGPGRTVYRYVPEGGTNGKEESEV